MQLVFSQYFKNASEVSYMLEHHFTLHYHVIYIDFNILAQLRFKNLSRHPLIGGSFIFQAKGHDLVVVASNESNKICLFLVR